MGVQVPESRRGERDEAEEQDDGVPGYTERHGRSLAIKDTRQLLIVTLILVLL
jgi:hypothetical protein